MGRLLVALVAVAALALALLLGATDLVFSGAGKRPRLVASAEVDVSQLPGPQSETAIAIDPRNRQILLAGSNDVRARFLALYSSGDGGRHWRRGHLSSPPGLALCEMSDPSLAIDGRGRQYAAFLGLRCRGRRRLSSAVYVASRPDASARWRMLPLAVARANRLTLGDDRPMLLIDDGAASPHRGRLYVGWTRFSLNPAAFANPESGGVDLLDAAALVSHSDDRGASWSQPFLLSHGGGPIEVRLAASASGALYAVWRDSKTDSLYIARSGDGSAFRPGRLVSAAVVPPGRSCHGFRASIPAQPRRCVSPNPVVSVDASSGPRRGRVYVTYGSTSLYGSQDVYVAAFDPQLRPLFGVGRPKQVNPTGGFQGPDTFLPTSAIDPGTGRLWVCYYESGLGRARKAARFACTASDDGGERWTHPRLMARVASDETGRLADRTNGYGDYEGVTAAAGDAYPIWTDGRGLRRLGEEVYTASLSEK